MENRTIIYLRTSSEEQDPELQKNDCLQLSKRVELREPEILEEKKSAFKDDRKRKEFNKILYLIKRSSLRALVVWDLDRIYRNRKKLVGFFELCKAFDCKIYSVRQTFLNEIQETKLPEGFEFMKDMMINNFIQFLGWIAEDESKKKSDRVISAIRYREDGAYSYKGKKWGRKRLSKNTIKKVLDLKKDNPEISIRAISKQVVYYDKHNNAKSISRSAVHKILSEKWEEKGLVVDSCP